jgi:two-component system, cell cycle sensor histidine kinase and response regulator CckA
MKSDVSFQLKSAAWPAFVVEAGGTIRHANSAAITFFGPKLEGEGLSLSALWADQTETAEQFLARWERSAAAVIPIKYHGKGGTVASFDTFICSARDSQQRYIFQLLKKQGGDTSRWIGAAEVAETKPGSHDSLIVHKQKLDCALQLTRTVALDFNNVLTGILGHTSLILSEMEVGHPWRASLLEVEKAAEKAAEIAHHLATFSRQEKESREHASGNLNSALRRVVEGFQKNTPMGIEWNLGLANHLYAVKFDEAKVQQAFVKIIENAVEAVGEVGKITVSSRNLDITEATQDRTAQLAAGAYVCIDISDTGIGIEAEFQSRIFEPFFSTKHGHRGLGLAWVYGIITNHRGGVAVSSEVRQGTSVRVYLPASQKLVAETTFVTANIGGNHTILMVDDEDLLLTMGKTVLTAFGYNVLTANSGPKALELVAESKARIDLVISDLVMPQMSGRELIEQLRLRLPGVPVLCTSGVVRLASDRETEMYLRKPFTSQELLQHVQQTLDSVQEE